MSYLNENGLARYDGLIKQWVTFKSGTVDGVDPLLNWQKTSTAGAVTCYPLPAAPIDPTVNFAFTETGPASGEKGPDNPSTITGVSSVKVTRCGKNLIPYPYVEAGRTENGLTITVSEDGVITVNGTASADTYFSLSYGSTSPKLKNGTTCSISGCPSGGGGSTYYFRAFNYQDYKDTGSGASFSITGPLGNLAIVIRQGVVASNLVFRPQLELGSTATSFEPYAGTDYTIPLGDTYYGGSVDLSTGIMTVTWAKEVFTGSNVTWKKWSHTNTAEFYNTGDIFTNRNRSRNALCTHFNKVSGTLADVVGFGLYNGGDGGYFFYPDINTSIDDFNNYLAAQYANDTPVTAVYELATPYIVQLTPTQIKSLPALSKYEPRTNTVYSDQESVQVGYPKSPIATDNELTNAIISLGGNV